MDLARLDGACAAQLARAPRTAFAPARPAPSIWRGEITVPTRRIEPQFSKPAERPADGEAVEAPNDDAPPPTLVRKPRPAPKPLRRAADGYALPSLNLLTAPRAGDRTTLSAELIRENGAALEGVLADFGVRGEIINARPGPVVTLYELEPAPGIKSSRVISLADDIARSMSALSARVAVVSGRNAIGIELPNPTREKVYLRELLASRDYAETEARLPLCLGKAIGGEAVLVDLSRMPHLLIAGTTGSGKSVAINTMILSLVYRLHPDQCRLIMVDPKMLETLRLRRHPAPAHPGRHRSEEGGGRAQMGGARNGAALQENVEARRAQHRRLQRARRRGEQKGRKAQPHHPYRLRPRDRRSDLRERGGRPRAAAVHRGHRRRNGRPDDGRRQGH